MEYERYIHMALMLLIFTGILTTPLAPKALKALIEYFKARKIAQTFSGTIDVSKIEQRIQDMKLRIDQDIFDEIEAKHG